MGDWVQELQIFKLFSFQLWKSQKTLQSTPRWCDAWTLGKGLVLALQHLWSLYGQWMSGDNSWAQRTITAQWSNLLLFVLLTAFSLISGTSIINVCTVQFTLFMCIFKKKLFLHKSENLCKKIFSNKPVSLFLLEIQPSHAFLNDTSIKFKLMIVW